MIDIEILDTITEITEESINDSLDALEDSLLEVDLWWVNFMKKPKFIIAFLSSKPGVGTIESDRDPISSPPIWSNFFSNVPPSARNSYRVLIIN